jgi:hypothetical protein
MPIRKITLRTDENIVRGAHDVARTRGTSLNAAFREWLEQYASQSGGGAAVDALMRRLGRGRSTGPYARDEMNER